MTNDSPPAESKKAPWYWDDNPPLAVFLLTTAIILSCLFLCESLVALVTITAMMAIIIVAFRISDALEKKGGRANEIACKALRHGVFPVVAIGCVISMRVITPFGTGLSWYELHTGDVHRWGAVITRPDRDSKELTIVHDRWAWKPCFWGCSKYIPIESGYKTSIVPIIALDGERREAKTTYVYRVSPFSKSMTDFLLRNGFDEDANAAYARFALQTLRACMQDNASNKSGDDAIYSPPKFCQDTAISPTIIIQILWVSDEYGDDPKKASRHR